MSIFCLSNGKFFTSDNTSNYIPLIMLLYVSSIPTFFPLMNSFFFIWLVWLQILWLFINPTPWITQNLINLVIYFLYSFFLIWFLSLSQLWIDNLFQLIENRISNAPENNEKLHIKFCIVIALFNELHLQCQDYRHLDIFSYFQNPLSHFLIWYLNNKSMVWWNFF